MAGVETYRFTVDEAAFDNSSYNREMYFTEYNGLINVSRCVSPAT